MKDRYLFRGKRLDNGEWIEGCLVVLPNGVHRIHWQPFPECTTNTYHAVDPDKIVQCTGLKNGKLIFEGDIFEVTTYKGKRTYLVKFSDSKNGYVGKILTYEDKYDPCDYESEMAFHRIMEKQETSLTWAREIIGNIHDED